MQERAVVRFAFAACAAGVLVALPLRLTSAGEGFVRVNDACGQATECYRQDHFICSTVHKDWEDYKCTQGCGGTD